MSENIPTMSENNNNSIVGAVRCVPSLCFNYLVVICVSRTVHISIVSGENRHLADVVPTSYA